MKYGRLIFFGLLPFCLFLATCYSNREADTPVRLEIKIAYFNKPDVLYVDEPAEIKLIVNTDDLTLNQLRAEFDNLTGTVARKTAKVGAFLTAKLTAPSSMLEIKQVDERIQAVPKIGRMIFAWYIKALRIGNIPIRLDLFSQEKLGNDQAVSPVEVLRENWTADARGLNWLTYRLTEIEPVRAALWTFLAGIGSFLTFVGAKRWLGKAQQSKSDE